MFTEGKLSYLYCLVCMMILLDIPPLTCRPLLSELKESLLLLNCVSRPWASQNCLSVQERGWTHEARMAAWPLMAGREVSSREGMVIMETRSWEGLVILDTRSWEGIMIMVMHWWTGNWLLMQKTDRTENCTNRETRAATTDDDQSDQSYPTLLLLERVTLLPDSELASKMRAFLDK